MELFKLLNINAYIINLKSSNQKIYKLIYSPKLILFETFKTYIKINWANYFLCLANSIAKVVISFDQKFNSNLCLYIDY